MPDSILSVVLTTTDEPHAVGAPIPVSVRVRNVSDDPIVIVGVLDGSEAGVRFPHYSTQITGTGDVPAAAIEFDMLAPIRPTDFRRLAPGEEFDPTDRLVSSGYLPLVRFNDFRPPAPGRYELRLTLATDADDPSAWFGTWNQQDTERITALVAQVPRVRVESNALVIVVR